MVEILGLRVSDLGFRGLGLWAMKYTVIIRLYLKDCESNPQTLHAKPQAHSLNPELRILN